VVRRLFHGQEPYSVAILICDALAYYYLRNPLPFDMPFPKPSFLPLEA